MLNTARFTTTPAAPTARKRAISVVCARSLVVTAAEPTGGRFAL
jgi:hypothetical protein